MNQKNDSKFGLSKKTISLQMQITLPKIKEWARPYDAKKVKLKKFKK